MEALKLFLLTFSLFTIPAGLCLFLVLKFLIPTEY